VLSLHAPIQCQQRTRSRRVVGMAVQFADPLLLIRNMPAARRITFSAPTKARRSLSRSIGWSLTSTYFANIGLTFPPEVTVSPFFT
jgi:hypothetical protein